MLKAYKTEIRPTREQIDKISRTLGTCRYVYNLFIAENKRRHETGLGYISGYGFSKWLNSTFLETHPECFWIKEVSSKSVKKSIMDADTAFKNFFSGKVGFPKFKKKGRSDVKMYFVKNNKTDCACERHKIKIPTLGWVRLKEKGYIPTALTIKSGTVSKRAGRYFVSVLIDVQDTVSGKATGPPLGIDLGVKDFATLSDGTRSPNVNKTQRCRKLLKRLRREQKKLSRKFEAAKKAKRKGGANIWKQVLEVQKLYAKIDSIRTDHVNKTVSGIVKAKPSHVVLEDLNVKGMLRNRHLSNAIASQDFYKFRVKLVSKCRRNGIEIRIVDRFFPSSKTCHVCGSVKKNLKLSERTYRCPSCGYSCDRDLNAALNLRDTTRYRLAI